MTDEPILPLIRRWLALPHVSGMVGRSVTNNMTLVSGDLDEPSHGSVHLSRQPAARSATCSATILTAWNYGFGPHPPKGTRGIDLFIGEPDMIERGHGSALHPRLRR